MTTDKPITITHRARPVGVFARKIVDVAGNVGGVGHLLTLDDSDTFVADNAMTARMFPTAGDYLVIGQDGYAYLNPAEVFESKYEQEEPAARTRFKEGDAVMFQPRVDLTGIPSRQYENTILAKVVRARIIDSFVHYDLALRTDGYDGAEEWTRIDNVPSNMALPMPEETAAAGGAPLLDRDTIQLRMFAVNAAEKTAGGDIVELLCDASMIEEYLLNGDPYGQIDPPLDTTPAMPVPKAPAISPAAADVTPNDGPRVTANMLAEHVAEAFYINPRQAVLALGGEDHPELDRASLCILLLKTGAIVIGSAIVSSLENVDENSGRQMAQQDAANRLADYLGFVMKHVGA